MNDRVLKYFYVTVYILILLLANGCNKYPINGNLDGQWQLMEVMPEPPETIVQGRLYVCINLHVCQLSSYGSGVQCSANLKYDSKDKLLSLHFPDVQSERGMAILRQYGIYSNPVTFDIELLSKSKLVLRDGDVVVTLRKF